MVAAPQRASIAGATTTDLDDLKRRRNALQLRLEDGYQRIEQGIQEGRDVTRWEDFWVQLLNEYTAICDAIRDVERS